MNCIAREGGTITVTGPPLIIGDGNSGHEKFVHKVAAGRAVGCLVTDDSRCPAHVSDLAAAILELASSEHSGIRHVGG